MRMLVNVMPVEQLLRGLLPASQRYARRVDIWARRLQLSTLEQCAVAMPARGTAETTSAVATTTASGSANVPARSTAPMLAPALQEGILASPELAHLLAGPQMQSKLSAILQDQDPLGALQDAQRTDPEGVGKVANVILTIMDKTQSDNYIL